MKLLFAVICRFAELDEEGVMNVRGILHAVRPPPEDAGPLPPLAFAAQIGFTAEEAGKHRVQLVAIGSGLLPTIMTDAVVETHEPKPHTTWYVLSPILAVPVGRVESPPALLQLSLVVDGKALGDVHLAITAPA